MNNREMLERFLSVAIPTEDEIIKSWVSQYEEPLVSILCHTYNQRRYIEDAIKGFLIQETSFAFEIILHDDASTDGTDKLILEYSKKYPSIIKSVVQEENQYSKGLKPSILSFQHARGSYIAMCEGDDFWIDARKLHLQHEALSKNADFFACAHPAIKMRSNGELSDYRIQTNQEHVSYNDILRLGGGIVPTPSLFIRREIFDSLPDWFSQAPVGDFFIELLASLKGNGIFIVHEVMSVYRVYSEGSWSARKPFFPADIYNKCIDEVERKFGGSTSCYRKAKSRNYYIASRRSFDVKNYRAAYRYAIRSIKMSPIFNWKAVIILLASSMLSLFRSLSLKGNK